MNYKASSSLKHLLLLQLFIFQCSYAHGQFNLFSVATPAQMIDSILGPGITVTNVTGILPPASSGTFSITNVPGISFTSGMYLSTGNTTTVELNLQESYQNSFIFGTPGDSQLDSLFAPYTTIDAASINFDFFAAADSVEFILLFASEAYNEEVNTGESDLVACFLTGPGHAPNTNVALVPGTVSYISNNTVNNGQWPPYILSAGPCMNCAYYVDNIGSGVLPWSMDGFTTEIKIKFAVWPCTSYHFKIAIGDGGLGGEDSMVMIGEDSFKSTSQPGINHAGQALNNGDTLFLCPGGSVTLSASPAPNYNWNTGDTTQSITVTQPGIYQYIIFGSPACFSYSQSVTVLQQGSPIQTPVIAQGGNTLYSPNLVPTPNMTFQWYLNGFPIPGANQTTCNISGLGCYMLIIYDGICESNSNEICTGVSVSEISIGQIELYPNPVTDEFQVRIPNFKSDCIEAELFDFTGRNICRRKNIPADPAIGVFRFSLSNQPPGLYTVRVITSQGVYIGKILKQ